MHRTIVPERQLGWKRPFRFLLLITALSAIFLLFQVNLGAAATLQTFHPTADAHVKSSSATRNYGDEDHVRLRAGSTTYQGYFLFDVAGISGTVSRATLRLYVEDGSPDVGTLYQTDTSWTETTITWDNAPALADPPLASLGQVGHRTWVEADVTAVITGNGSYSFGLASSSSNSTYFGSRESSFPAELIIEVDDTPPSQPTAVFTADTTSGFTPLTVNFSDQSTGVPASWAWDFGDGNSSTAQNPSHTYQTAGTYTVSLTVSNAIGNDTVTKTNHITVTEPPPPEPPTAVFTADSLAGEAPHTVTFTDQSTGVPTSWQWDFGDGGSSSQQHPSHVYTAAGVYTVSLTVSNADGDDSETKTNYITITAPPAPSEQTFYPTDDAHVKSSSPTRSYGTLSSMRTRFGNPQYDIYLKFAVTGVTNTVEQVLLRLYVDDASNDGGDLYLVANDYNTGGAWNEVGLTFENAPGLETAVLANLGATTRDTWVEVDITAVVQGNGIYSFGLSTNSTNSAYYSTKEGSNPPELIVRTSDEPVVAPTAAFTADTTSGAAPHTVSFADQSTDAPTSWAWDFGDGHSSTQQNPTHTYQTAGSYTVALTVSNVGGSDSETKTDYITVTVPSPTAAFTADTTSGTFPHTVNFTDQSTGNPTSWAWDFGDGNTSTEQSPSHTYQTIGSYTVTLTASNSGGSDGETKTDYITVTTLPPTAVFTADTTTGLAPHTVNFTDQSTGNPTSWAWDFGDGNSSTAQNPSHTYNTPGVYTVMLTASNSGGSDGETKTDYITVTTPPPTAVFSADTTSGTLPHTVNFSDESTGNPTSWLWDFGDGTTSTEQNPSHTYQTANTFTVQLTVSNAGGSHSETKTDYITISLPPAPVAAFSADSATGDAPHPVNFSDDSTNSPTSWAWDFGDGNTSTAQNPSHTYATPGTYTVMLTVSNAGGDSSETKTDYITVHVPLPTAVFTADTTSGTVPHTVNFTDQSTGNPTRWAWDFGDGNTSTEQDPSHTYQAAGNYTVTLTVTNTRGSDSEVKTDYITVTVPPPTAVFTADTTSGIVPHTVNFTDQSTGNPTSWAWDFGDGNTSTEQNPSHTYQTAGVYTVTLTASNSGGSHDEVKSDYITVTVPPPTAAFSADTTSGTVPHTVNFSDESTGNPTSWLWDFGDGTTSTEQNPSHTYQTANAFTVQLTVSNAGGDNSETKTSYITISLPPAPVAAFSADSLAGDVPHTVNFTDESTGNPTSWLWDFGDGNTSTEQNPSHTYQTANAFTVQLTVSNAGGDSSETKTSYITVTLPPPTAAFSADTTSGNAPLSVNFSDESTGNPTSWEWDFGDGNGSTEQNPAHTYNNPGLYTVVMTATNSISSDAVTKVDYINVATPPTGHVGLWISLDEIAELPDSGTAWDLMVQFANDNNDTPDLSDQGTNANVAVMARALIYARTGDQAYRDQVIDALRIITYNNTESGGRTLALGRELLAYIIAADLISLPDVDPALDADFRAKLIELRTETLGSGATLNLITTHEIRANNWGTHAGASRAAIALYLDDQAELERVAQVFEGWLGNRDRYADFDYKETDWFCDAANPTGINPVGCTRDGHSIDGALPEEMRRAGNFNWPPSYTGYAWEGMQGVIAMAHLLDRAGYPAWEWEDRAVLRATTFLHDIGWIPDGDDVWQPWLLNAAYSTNFPTDDSARPGKNVGWTSWTHPTPPPAPPQADFTADLTNGVAPLTIQFSDQTSGIPTSWAWDFGDGNSSTEQHPAHTYTTPGTYTVKLTATNDLGSDTAEKVALIVVTAPPAPEASFSANVVSGIAPLTVSFSDATINGPTSWAWDFGDGGTASSQNPVHTYNSPGVYTVVMTATNSTGSDTRTRTDYITVAVPPPPTAAFHAQTTTGAAPFTVTFVDDSTGNPTQWFWNFGDGQNSTQQGPMHTYDTPGVYTVSLLVTNSQGNDSLEKVDYIVVVEAPTEQTFTATADAHVKSSSPTRNYGTEDHVRTRFGDPDYDVYVQFEVTGVSGPVTAAKLRFYVTDGSPDGGDLYLVSNDYRDGSEPWTELGLTYDNAPLLAGVPLTNLGSTTTGSWVEVDITAVITASGTYSFALDTQSTNSAYYSSREGAFAPELVIEN